MSCFLQEIVTKCAQSGMAYEASDSSRRASDSPDKLAGSLNKFQPEFALTRADHKVTLVNAVTLKAAAAEGRIVPCYEYSLQLLC